MLIKIYFKGEFFLLAIVLFSNGQFQPSKLELAERLRYIGTMIQIIFYVFHLKMPPTRLCQHHSIRGTLYNPMSFLQMAELSQIMQYLGVTVVEVASMKFLGHLPAWFGPSFFPPWENTAQWDNVVKSIAARAKDWYIMRVRLLVPTSPY